MTDTLKMLSAGLTDAAAAEWQLLTCGITKSYIHHNWKGYFSYPSTNNTVGGWGGPFDDRTG